MRWSRLSNIRREIHHHQKRKNLLNYRSRRPILRHKSNQNLSNLLKDLMMNQI